MQSSDIDIVVCIHAISLHLQRWSAHMMYAPANGSLSFVWLISFQDAVAALNTLQSNFSIVDAVRKSGQGMNKQSIPEMIEWCRKLGYQVSV